MELLTPSEAADVAGVHERTLRKWARAGIITRHLGPDGRPGYAREEVTGLSVAGPASGRVGAGLGPLEGRNGAGQEVADPDSGPLNASRGWNGAGLSPGAAVQDHVKNSSHGAHRADLAEQKAALLEEERNRLVEDVQHLRAQLDLRSHEIEQERRAGEQLRVMLLRLEETNRELAGALVQKSLPPAPEPDTQPATPKKARWWSLWR